MTLYDLVFCTLSLWCSSPMGCADIRAGADLDKKDLVGRTPLPYAALNMKSNSVIALVEAGANRDELDYMGRTLIHCAALKCTLSDLSHLVTRVLKIRGSRPRQLIQRDFDGWTPLHWYGLSPLNA